MRNDINIRRLFIVACLAKVVCALAGWYFNSPWILGFVIPLVVMCGYMWLGATRRNPEVSDEKFADSCYYLGFIFTIASISVALMDLPNIGTQIQNIAVRFGAAMLSTVLGLSVRVAMVTFRPDFSEAVDIAQERVVQAAVRFSDQLHMVLDRLKSFEAAVDDAARNSVVRANLQLENLAKNHAANLAQFFATLTNSNEKAFTEGLQNVRQANAVLTESTNDSVRGMRSNLDRIETDVVAFSNVVTNWRKTVGESATKLCTAIGNLHDKTSTADTALESVNRLAAQQQLLMNGAQRQLDRLDDLGVTLQGLNDLFARAVQGFENTKGNDAQFKEAIHGLVSDGQVARKEMCDRLKEVADILVAVTKDQSRNLDQVRSTDAQVARTLSALGDRSTAHFHAVVKQLNSITRHPATKRLRKTVIGRQHPVTHPPGKIDALVRNIDLDNT